MAPIIGTHTEYELGVLDEGDVADSPIDELRKWLDIASANEAIVEPNAMTLATVSASGHPSARVVLLRSLDENGLTFYTNYDSHKGHDLAANNAVAAVFFWPLLQRQVRVQATANKLSAADSDAYFAGRPVKSQIGAAVSNQSDVIANRQVLEDAVAGFDTSKPIHRPDNWGGYRLTPTLFEFWQGRRSRLHDRLRYTRRDGGWKIERIAP